MLHTAPRRHPQRRCTGGDNTRRTRAGPARNDGHGGTGAATYLDHRLHKHLVKSEAWEEHPGDALRAAIGAADAHFCKGADRVSGSCCLAAVVRGAVLYLGNAGDCRAVLCRKGKAVQATRDHDPGDPGERERIERLGGGVSTHLRSPPQEPLCACLCVCGAPRETFPAVHRVQPGNLAVARAVGDARIKAMHPNPLVTADAESYELELTPKDEFLVLATDGVWGGGGGNLSCEQAVKVVRAALNDASDGDAQAAAQLAAKRLTQESERRAATRLCDNASVTVVVFHWSKSL